MKKFLFPLIALALVASVGMAQTQVIRIPKANKDTDVYTFTPSTYNAEKVIPSSYTPASFTHTTKPYQAPSTTPPVIPPVVPPVTTPGKKKQLVSALSYDSKSNIVIANDSIPVNGAKQVCINLNNCHDVRITHNFAGGSADVVVKLTGCYNITVDSNTFIRGTTIVRVIDCPNGGIRILYNYMQDPIGPVSNNGTGQFVQFDNVQTTGVQNVIQYNHLESMVGAGQPEDAISMYLSNGTATLPIDIGFNWIRGGGPSKNGGGIMLGDNGGKYQIAHDNILVNPGQYGISISGGPNNSIINNQVFAAKSTITNVGIYVWAQKGDQAAIPTISNATVSGNLVNWTNSAGSANPYWLGTGESKPSGWPANASAQSAITAAILPSNIKYPY